MRMTATMDRVPLWRPCFSFINSQSRFGWHNLRHSLADFLAGEVDVAVTMKMLHHKRLSTTAEAYTHHASDKQQAAPGLFLEVIKRAIPASKALQ
jgi:integrase